MTSQTLTLILSTTGIGYLMVRAGLGKHALEARRSRRVCPSCGREIVGRDPPTDPGDRLGDALGQLAAIERVRPASRDRAKRRREIGLLEQLA
jgi:hypothetical protein